MDYSRRRKQAVVVKTGSLVELYPCNVQMYQLPPSVAITLTEFEEMAQDRLKALRIIDTINLKPVTKFSEEWKSAFIAELKKAGLQTFSKLVSGAGCGQTEAELQARKWDHISHFILRLAYCRSEDLRRWFISREVDFFKIRFLSLTKENIQFFFKVNNLSYTPITEDEKSRLREYLHESTAHFSGSSVDTQDFYCVPFTDVLDLVRSRKVYLSHGQAYVPSSDLVSVIVTIFRTNLARGLAKKTISQPEGSSVFLQTKGSCSLLLEFLAMHFKDLKSGKSLKMKMKWEDAEKRASGCIDELQKQMTARKVPLEEDERISRLLKDLHHSYTGEEYLAFSKNNTNTVRLDQLDILSRCSFPPCMRQLYEHIRANHHSKHGGRQQFGLFIKGIGLSLEDAMTFWREEFTKLIDVDKFEKQYAYNIRHNYGKEGRRVNYTPYSCMKIISQGVGPGDTHGCTFKHSDINDLKQRLLNWKLPIAGIQEIADYVIQGHYQLACGKYFQLTHGTTNMDIGINHPNQYFIESQKLLSEKQDAGEKGVPSSQTSKSSSQNVTKTEDLWGEDFSMNIDL